VSERFLTRVQWELGSEDLARVARERAKEILATHQPDPLPRDIETELDAKKMEIVKRLARSSLAAIRVDTGTTQ
jgi:trimethylamine:corrinoid methyltransferase-like protein